MNKTIWFGVLVLSAGGVLQANDIYIAQSAAGAGNGSSCANAYAMTYFNTSTNWSSAASGTKIGPGSTVHLCGTFSAAAGTSGLLTVQGSGTSGSPVTIVAETGLLMQAPYWGVGGAITASGVSWVTMNGQNTGTIQATANGTNLANQAPSCGSAFCTSGLSMVQCDNCVIENWTIANIYVNVPPNDESNAAGTSTGIFYNGGNNSTVSGNTVHDAKWCVVFGFWPQVTTQNVTISGNTLYNCDHGVAVYSDNSGATLSNLSVSGNTIHDAVNWDDAMVYNHHDGIHISPVQASTQINGAYLYNNYIYGDWGANCNSYIYVEAGPQVITNANLFNNVLVNTVAGHGCANGLLQDYNAQNSLIANNTLVGPTQSSGQGLILEEYSQYHSVVKNNIVMGFQNAMYVGQSANTPVSDYNDFYNVANIAAVWGVNCCNQLQQWTAQSGSPDQHSLTGNPNLNSSYIPQAGSPVHLAGINLTSVGLTALDSDKAGTARPSGACTASGASGCWDLGAYQLSAGTGAVKPNPPSQLNAQAK